MRWTSVACLSCLFPVLAGCSSARHAVQYVAQSVTADNGSLPTRADDELRREAQTVWQSVGTRHPGRAFSDEFRDGFVDGYADFRAHGETSQAPAVPPVPYERYKKYLGRDGHSLVRDYYLGFQYGGEVAVARRPGPTPESAPRTGAPVGPKSSDAPPPRPVPEKGKFGEPRKGSGEPPLLLPLPPGTGDGAGRAIPPLPKPEVPYTRSPNPDPSGARITPIPVPSEPERLPVPDPPLPVLEPIVVPIVVPASERTPTVLDDIPVIPLRYPPK